MPRKATSKYGDTVCIVSDEGIHLEAIYQKPALFLIQPKWRSPLSRFHDLIHQSAITIYNISFSFFFQQRVFLTCMYPTAAIILIFRLAVITALRLWLGER